MMNEENTHDTHVIIVDLISENIKTDKNLI